MWQSEPGKTDIQTGIRGSDGSFGRYGNVNANGPWDTFDPGAGSAVDEVDPKNWTTG
jgi:hypothetical protein